ncbi:MAG: cupin domain-containing protein, partial [Cyanobacteria bacterium J06632_22]
MKQTSLHTVPEQGVSHNGAIRKRVLLRAGDLPHLTQFAQASFAPGQVAAAHAHSDMHEVFLVQSGQVSGSQQDPLANGTVVGDALLWHGM